jgi:hypothetical protein
MATRIETPLCKGKALFRTSRQRHGTVRPDTAQQWQGDARYGKATRGKSNAAF